MIVDFTNVPVGNYVRACWAGRAIWRLSNRSASRPGYHRQILQFNVIPAVAPDPTTPPQFLVLPPITPLPPETVTRPLALIEAAGFGADSEAMKWKARVEALLRTVEAAIQ